MKIAVFGATGRTGKPFTELALEEGYQVRALLRTPDKLGIQNPNLQVIQGDLTDATKVEETIRGTEAVLFLVGMSPDVRVPPDLRVVMTRNVLDAMQKTGVKRIIRLVNFAAVKDERDKPGLMMKLMLSMTKNNVAQQDEKAGAELIKQSQLDWTIVRNSMIKPSAATGVYKAGYVGEGKDSVTSGDLAAFILNELKNEKYIKQTPFVHN